MYVCIYVCMHVCVYCIYGYMYAFRPMYAYIIICLHNFLYGPYFSEWEKSLNLPRETSVTIIKVISQIHVSCGEPTCFHGNAHFRSMLAK